MAAHRRLVLIRHARAQQADTGPDHERILTDAGRADAESLGRWLKEHGISPEETLCSTSARTRETWAGIVDASGIGAIVDHDERIYNGRSATLLKIVNEVHPKAQTAVMIGHAPGIPMLAASLADGQGDPGALAQLEANYPTCTAAVLDFEGEWAQAGPATARLVAVHTARAED